MILNWVRSSFCDSSACIEVAHDDHRTYIRDTETGVIIQVANRDWDTFERGVVAGEFRRDTVGE